MAIMLVALSVNGCNSPQVTSFGNVSSTLAATHISDVFKVQEITNETLRAVRSYQDIYASIPQYPDVSFIIPYNKSEQIVNRISKLGFPVYAHDMNLKLSEQMRKFYQGVKSGKEAEIGVYSVQTDGSLARFSFKYINRQLYFAMVSASWTDSNTPRASCNDFGLIDRYEWTKNGYFLFHVAHQNFNTNYSSGFRVQPLPDVYWTYCKKYIEPVGYLGNNLFSTNWDKNSMQKLNFNDMFQYIYQLEYRKEPDFQTPYPDYDESSGKFEAAVPVNDFESVITKYFPISADQLRKLAVYDPTHKVYAWNSYFIDDEMDQAPDSEVAGAKTNRDGSLTLSVDVLDLNNYSDCGIRHTVTVMPHKDGSFQYLSNSVKRVHSDWFPSYEPRVAKER